jgi:glycine/D-amino acid oxidase-like deaminating enzyme
MSAPTKLRGGTRSELTRFKRLWLTLAEPARDFWRERFASEATQAQLRAEIRAKLKINLVDDKQLTAFRKYWLEEQDARDAEAQASEQDEAELTKLGLSGDALRAVLLDRMKGRALTQGDFKLGLQAIDRDLKQQQVGLDRDKFQFDATKAALAKLDSLKAIKGNSKLSEEQKLEQARLELFGVAPK